jgi:hypothetical protein
MAAAILYSRSGTLASAANPIQKLLLKKGIAPAPGAVFRALAENPSGPRTSDGSLTFRA